MALLFFVIILGFLVFIHEYGHFFAARRSGVAVEEFGFGFPPRIIGWRRGQTTYSLNWIPFGGFVRLLGEQEGQGTDPRSFTAAPFRKQFLIMSAGVLMNAALAWMLLSTALMAGVNIDTADQPHNRFARVSGQSTIAVVNEGTAAAEAGLVNGDTIVSVEGKQFSSTDDVIAFTQAAQYPSIHVLVSREGQPLEVTITPRPGTDHPRYGFGLQQVAKLQYPWYVAPWYGFSLTADLTRQTLNGFGRLARDLLTTAKVSEDLTGPVGIAVLTGQVVQYGFIATLQFMAILSISLAVVNFLPLPALDGGRAVFAVVKRIRGRAISPRIEGAIHAVGFYLLLLLIIVLSVRDVSRFGLVEQLRSVFQ